MFEINNSVDFIKFNIQYVSYSLKGIILFYERLNIDKYYT